MIFLIIFFVILVVSFKKPKPNKKEIKIVTPTPNVKIIEEKPLQYVIFSFDGSESIKMWEATRNFAKEMNRQNKPIKFTYFVSGVYFLSEKNKDQYQAPGQKIGYSKIDFAKNEEDIAKRREELKLASSEGHEIGSHLNGHFNGSKWTEADWKSELSQFGKLVPIKIVGLRAPLLAVNKNLYKVLPEFAYKYDASAVGKMGDWPVKNEFGIWEIPLITLKIGNKYSLSMDYNLFLAQTNGKDILKKGTPDWTKSFNEIITAYRNYFNYNYSKTKAPVIIADHFSTWNDGLYWEAMKSFATEVCGRSDIRCTTMSELVKYLEAKN